MQPGLCPGIDARFGLSFLLDFVGCQCNAGSRPGPGPGPESGSIPFFLKGYCFRVKFKFKFNNSFYQCTK